MHAAQTPHTPLNREIAECSSALAFIASMGMGMPSSELVALVAALADRSCNRSGEDGARMLAVAAESGDAEADAMIAVLIGIDAQSNTDWDKALDYLGRAAARGLPAARAQLALYCPNPELVAASMAPSPPAPVWRQMKETIDIDALLKIPPARLVRDSPHIAVFDGFATRAECEWIIARAKPHLERAKVLDQLGRGVSYIASRTNSAMQFDILRADFVLIVLQARIAAAAGFATRCLEETNVLHYGVGEEFVSHYDFFNPDQPAFQRELSECGQRAATFLLYLNDEFEGGETDFEKLGWRYRGRPGDALLFRNVAPSGAPDLQTLHAGLPPRSGEKWVLSQWIRTRPPQRSVAPAEIG
jgi:prolyl 4-hydroxylase